MSQKFEELHISVTPVGDDKYLVRTEQAPKGVLPAEEQVVWPVEEWLNQAGKLMEDPLVGWMLSNQLDPDDDTSAGRKANTHLLNLVELGRELYLALFQGSLLDRLTSAQAIAHNQGNVLRLRLGVKGPLLPRLPWEVIHEDARAIATGKDIVFSRYQPTLAPVALPPSHGNLVKVLMVLTAPSDRETLALKREALYLKEELNKQWRGGTPVTGKPPQVQLDILEQPNREELTRALEQNHYQVLHYSGHSDVGAGGGEVYLVNRHTGLSEPLTGNDLAGLLVNAGIRMAVFNSCRGAYTASSDPTDATGKRSLAEVLVKRGVPGVLAMAERIADDVALTLTRLFYYNIKQGYPVDLSLNRARQGLMSAYGSHQLYWALPVLYLHPEFDGYLTSEPPEPIAASTSRGIKATVDSSRPLTPANSNSFLSRSEIPPSHSAIASDAELGWDEDLDALDETDLDEIYEDRMYDDLDDREAELVVSELFRQIVKEEENSEASDAKGLPEPSDSNPNSSSLANRPPDGAIAPQTPSSFSALFSGWKRWVPIAALSTLAIAGVGLWIWQTRLDRTSYPSRDIFPPTPLASPSTPLNPLEPINLTTAKTPEVAQLAFAAFNEDDAIAGQQAVEELLKPQRNALNYAEAVLSGVREPYRSTPEINFLWGRLAWQAVQSGNSKYSLDDVRRYWDRAVEQTQDKPLYYNALGFAHYADGNLQKAENSWLQSLKLLEKMPVSESPNSTTPQPSPLESADALNAYAGFALVLMRSLPQLPESDRPARLSKAIKLREMVLSVDSLRFQPDALAANWMWPESAVEDWRSLLLVKE